jgi:hypothetical protein
MFSCGGTFTAKDAIPRGASHGYKIKQQYPETEAKRRFDAALRERADCRSPAQRDCDSEAPQDAIEETQENYIYVHLR